MCVWQSTPEADTCPPPAPSARCALASFQCGMPQHIQHVRPPPLSLPSRPQPHVQTLVLRSCKCAEVTLLELQGMASLERVELADPKSISAVQMAALAELAERLPALRAVRVVAGPGYSLYSYKLLTNSVEMARALLALRGKAHVAFEVERRR